MRKNILNRLTVFFILLLFVFSSCATKKELVKADAPTPTTVVNETKAVQNLPDSIRKNQLDFSILAVKAKAEIKIGKKENNVTLTIRAKKDEAIWVAVTALAGIEVARALITPDSIKLMNKVENTYIKKPFSYLHEFAGEELNFNMLQAILTGNVGEQFFAGNASFANSSPQLTGVVNNLIYQFLFNSNYKLIQANLKDPVAKQELEIAYNGWSLSNGQELPGNIMIKSIAENSLDIKLEYSKAVFNGAVEMPFTVPKRFEVIK